MANTTLDLLVERLFDYSGMFPPEAKSFRDAIADCAAFPQSLTRPYMVNADMVLTLNDLQSLNEATLQAASFTRPDISIALLGSEVQAESIKIAEEFDTVSAFNETGKGARCRQQITSYEVKVGACADSLLAQLFPYISPFESIGVTIALEPDLSGGNWAEVLERAISFVSQFKDSLSLKFRGTGPTKIGNEKIAFVVAAVSEAGIHCKATGGLHHPFLEERYGNNLGFLGLSVALFLRRGIGESFTIDDIMGCLCASDPSEMELETSLAWREKSITLEKLKELKKHFRFSIGSCSIREPDEDLVRIFG